MTSILGHILSCDGPFATSNNARSNADDVYVWSPVLGQCWEVSIEEKDHINPVSMKNKSLIKNSAIGMTLTTLHELPQCQEPLARFGDMKNDPDEVRQ